MKQRKGAAGKSWLSRVLLILVLILAIGIGIISLYLAVTEKVIDLSIQSMDELALHDEVAIMKSLEYRWNTLAGVGVECRQAKCGTISELLDLLHLQEESTGSLDLALMDEDGTLYYGALFIRQMPNVEALCRKEGRRFVVRYDGGTGANVTSQREALLFGMEITPFTVEEKTFTHALCRFHLDTLASELKIDSYDGKGYSSVIDRDGNYIVNINQSHNLQSRENFFADVAQYHLDDDTDIEEIRERLARDESFTLSFEADRGRELMHFTPMTKDVDWYFVIRAPRSVFEAQSLGILQLVLLVFVAMGTAVVLVLLLTLRSRQAAAQARLEQIHKEELRAALDLAEQANRAKTTFLNNMSHDIRTPMNAIIGFTALASSHIDDTAQVKGYLAKIGQSSSHLLSLINDVLDMSRIESGKMVLDEKPENLAEILQNIRNIIQTDIHARQLKFYVDAVNVMDEDIYCDKLRLNQVLLNLLSNAMKFTPAGGSVSLRLIEKEQKRAGWGDYELRVRDTGIGMSEEFAATIFEPFTREQTSTVSGIQGTGLGMSITKNIVDMMNGTITVHSEKGKGTEFVIFLSFALQDRERELEPITTFSGVRALVVDDDTDSCQSVSQMLCQAGLQAEWTAYGKDAVVRAREALETGVRYGFYMIDWQMPDQNGLETVRQIRELAGVEVPVILMTAYTWGELEAEARQAGVTALVSKPLFPSALNGTLRKLCDETAEEAAREESEVSFEGRRLLLAEDNELNREIATELLQDWGFLIETAENGQEAVDAVKDSSPGYFDAVLMDVQMPVMNGYEACQAIRKLDDPALAKILIIAMTANAFKEDRQAALDAGMDAHVGKPIDIPVLLDTLRRFLL